MIKKIPKKVIAVLKTLGESGFEAFIVGGCVRDLIVDRIPKDWDVATNAKPEEVQKYFPDSFYENEFGTVGVKVEPFIKNGNTQKEHDVIEVTTYRIESKYSDKRRPDKVEFAKTLEEDLSRRDFTINAIALRITNFTKLRIEDFETIDPYDGRKDIEKKIICAVGNAHERFDEDALRMMRAIRFASTLNGNSKSEILNPKQIQNSKSEKNLWKIEPKTLEAIKKYASNLKFIALERIKTELTEIILSNNPAEGIDLLHETGLLEYIIPELEKGVGIAQNRHHIYTIYKHSILSLEHCPSPKLEVRLAALLHDIAKPQTKKGEGEFATFYNHDHVGSKVAAKILERLRFSRETIEKVKLLVDNHMFYYNPEEVGESSVRRLIQKVGLENMKDLIAVRIADRLGSGTPKAKPYKLRHLEYMIDKLSHDAVSVKMLKINGNDLMTDLQLKPGPKIGAILDVLLSEVIEDASQNNRENLLSRAKELDKEDLEKLRQIAKVKIEEKKEEEDKEIKSKHWVQ
jgi:tRNA nucleotidyltransferase (CCA-adding enzyme)